MFLQVILSRLVGKGILTKREVRGIYTLSALSTYLGSKYENLFGKGEREYLLKVKMLLGKKRYEEVYNLAHPYSLRGFHKVLRKALKLLGEKG